MNAITSTDFCCASLLARTGPLLQPGKHTDWHLQPPFLCCPQTHHIEFDPGELEWLSMLGCFYDTSDGQVRQSALQDRLLLMQVFCGDGAGHALGGLQPELNGGDAVTGTTGVWGQPAGAAGAGNPAVLVCHGYAHAGDRWPATPPRRGALLVTSLGLPMISFSWRATTSISQ